MLGFFNKRAREPLGPDPLILDAGLRLAMQWGEDWLKPIQLRLAKQFPLLSTEDLGLYNKLCREAMYFGHSHLVDLTVANLKENGGSSVDDGAIRARWHASMRERYPWIGEDNLGSLYSQSMYYAMK